MRTIQITIDDVLLKQVDRAISHIHTTRSAFVRSSLELALHRLHIGVLEEKHRKGYQKTPLATEEFDIWHNEQQWGSAWNGEK